MIMLSCINRGLSKPILDQTYKLSAFRYYVLKFSTLRPMQALSRECKLPNIDHSEGR